jgi:uncharacterized Zn finger protein
MAPDKNSVAAGKKLGNIKHWNNLGYNTEALWGECQGSTLYQVRVELSSLTLSCSCPSRKHPCKHLLGLLLIAAETPSAIAEQEPPDWVLEWLGQRAAIKKRRETIEQKRQEPQTNDPNGTRQKRAAKRQSEVERGIEHLDLWLEDLVRNGLGSLETQSIAIWEQQAARMVDAKLPGVASRIRSLAAIHNATPDWPAHLLTRLGQIALLSQAFHHLEQLDANLQEDVRLMLGWTLEETEVLARGEHLSDNWLVLGQIQEETPRGRTQRTWLLGEHTQRSALLEQFAAPGLSFSKVIPTGVCWQGTLVFWPGTSPLRALIETRSGPAASITQSLPGNATIEEFCKTVAAILAHHPWRYRFLCTLCTVTPVFDQVTNRWYLRDRQGQGLPLKASEGFWQLLATSGGHALDLAGEWDGELLTPLGFLSDGIYHIAERAA